MGNNFSIKFSSDEFETNLNELKKKVDEMNKLFDDIKTKTGGVSSYWNGNLSNSNLESFNNFLNVFEDISVKNKDYMDFLDKTCVKYKLMETMINKAIEDGQDALSINGSNK